MGYAESKDLTNDQLVERLLFFADVEARHGNYDRCDLYSEAAKRISKLTTSVAKLEEMVKMLGRVADSAEESLASATGSAALEPDEYSLLKVALSGGDGLETGLAAAAIRMSNRVAELEKKLASVMSVVDDAVTWRLGNRMEPFTDDDGWLIDAIDSYLAANKEESHKEK